MELQGKKTYIVGIAMIAYAIGGLIIGEMDANNSMQLLFTALGLMGLRHGISNQ